MIDRHEIVELKEKIKKLEDSYEACKGGLWVTWVILLVYFIWLD